MSNVITKRIAEYDLSDFNRYEIKMYLENPDVFLDRYEFYELEGEEVNKVGDLKESEVTEEIIQEIVWRDELLPGDAWETFEHDMGYFDQYIGETFSVVGTNMGWQNRTGQKDVEVGDGMDLFKAIEVNTDFSVRFWKESDDAPGVYWASLHHHDSPTGETYEFTLKQ
tara:strand:- start:1293 stop:1796 length:504 start_codon:yes stop_codon:yes gene_type:complete